MEKLRDDSDEVRESATVSIGQLTQHSTFPVEPLVDLLESATGTSGVRLRMRSLASARKTANVTELLEHARQLNLMTKNEETALSFAIVWDYREVARLLVRAGADVNLCTSDGSTPLSFALAPRVKRDLVRFLLENGADPDVGSISGTSYPIYALRLEDEVLAIEFLTKTKNLNYRDRYGFTLLGFARQGELTKVVKVLESLGRKIDPAEFTFPRSSRAFLPPHGALPRRPRSGIGSGGVRELDPSTPATPTSVTRYLAKATSSSRSKRSRK